MEDEEYKMRISHAINLKALQLETNLDKNYISLHKRSELFNIELRILKYIYDKNFKSFENLKKIEDAKFA